MPHQNTMKGEEEDMNTAQKKALIDKMSVERLTEWELREKRPITIGEMDDLFISVEEEIERKIEEWEALPDDVAVAKCPVNMGQKLDLKSTYFTRDGWLESSSPTISTEVVSIAKMPEPHHWEVGFQAEGTDTSVFLEVFNGDDAVKCLPPHKFSYGIADVVKYAKDAGAVS